VDLVLSVDFDDEHDCIVVAQAGSDGKSAVRVVFGKVCQLEQLRGLSSNIVATLRPLAQRLRSCLVSTLFWLMIMAPFALIYGWNVWSVAMFFYGLIQAGIDSVFGIHSSKLEVERL